MVAPWSTDDDLAERPATLADATGLIAPAAERDEVDELADDLDRWAILAKQHSPQNRTVTELEAELDAEPEAEPEIAAQSEVTATAAEVEAAAPLPEQPAPENRTVAELEAELDAEATAAATEFEAAAAPLPEQPAPENRTVAELEAELDAETAAIAPEVEAAAAPLPEQSAPENRTVAELEAELDAEATAAATEFEAAAAPLPEQPAPENRTVAELEAELDAEAAAVASEIEAATPEVEPAPSSEPLESESPAVVAADAAETQAVQEIEAEPSLVPELVPDPEPVLQEMLGDVPGELPDDFSEPLASADDRPSPAPDDAQPPSFDDQPTYPQRDPALADNLHLNRWLARLSHAAQGVVQAKATRSCGRLTRAAGLVLEAIGIRLPVGAGCLIELPPGNSAPLAEAEVVGFSGERLFLMPTTEVSGLLPGARVYPLEASPIRNAYSGAKRLPVGIGMLGRVVDASGRPLDDLGPLNTHQNGSLSAPTINPLLRDPIHEVLDVGVRAINALLTVGRGQRMGLFAGSGVGKSVLLGMMARYTSADVIVVGLIGERGREVKEFIEQILGHEGLARAVVVAAPADVSPLMRMQGAAYATSLAEAFRDEGKSVLLIMDSLTRYAMAQREIALAIGEPPATKGYPPSVFAKLPMLVERAGNGEAGGGSITAFYTVLTEGDDQQDPIADAARAILDGHVVLSRTLAEAAHYPAIDIEASISRAMASLVTDAQFDSVRQLKQMLSRYQRNRDLINVGAYASGRDPMLDRAITLYPRIESFLQQRMNERCDHGTSVAQLAALVR